MTDVQEQVMATLRRGSSQVDGLAEMTGVPESELHGALVRLVRDGYVAMVQAYWPENMGAPTAAGWLYSLTAKGTAELDGRDP